MLNGLLNFLRSLVCSPMTLWKPAERWKNHLLLYSRYITPSSSCEAGKYSLSRKNHSEVWPKNSWWSFGELHSNSFVATHFHSREFSFPSFPSSLPNFGMCGFERTSQPAAEICFTKIANKTRPFVWGTAGKSAFLRLETKKGSQEILALGTPNRGLEMENGGALIIFFTFYHIPSCCLHFIREILCPIND